MGATASMPGAFRHKPAPLARQRLVAQLANEAVPLTQAVDVGTL